MKHSLWFALLAIALLAIALAWVGCSEQNTATSPSIGLPQHSQPSSSSLTTAGGGELQDGEMLSCGLFEDARIRFSDPGFIDGDRVGMYIALRGMPETPKQLRLWWDWDNAPNQYKNYVIDGDRFEEILEHRYMDVSGTAQKKVRIELTSDANDSHCVRVRHITVRSSTDVASGGAAPLPAVATSCAQHRANGQTTSGVYTLDPDGSGPGAAFSAYCDMTTDGGGWTMCYTERNNMVHIATEITYNSALPYGTPGYRTNCQDIPFSEVLYENHDAAQRAWFKRQSPGTVSMTGMGYSANGSIGGLWTPFGAAAPGNYQLNSCDGGWMWVGLMMSGYTGCWKQCGSWCGDGGTSYFRTDGDNGGGYNGVAFNENGHRNVGYKTMSVGVR